MSERVTNFTTYKPMLRDGDLGFILEGTSSHWCYHQCNGFGCTRDIGHDGPHVAHTTSNAMIASWECKEVFDE